MGEFSIWHWLVLIVIVMLLFGRGKVSDLMGDVAQGIKAFKKGMATDDAPAPKASEAAKAVEPPVGDEPPRTEPARHAESTNS
jgi:sec-independent protein translocase protein TatA